MRRRDVLATLALPLCGTRAQAAGAATVPGDAWGVAGPESSWPADGLQTVDRVASALRSDAVLVAHRGAIVHAFGDIAKPVDLFSVRKSLVSVLYGIEVERGTIELDATLAQLGIDDRQPLSEAEKAATVRQLLQARSGVYHPAAYEPAAMAAARPARGSHAPGTHFFYNNWDFNTLGTIFQKRTGRSLFEAFEAELAKPLQMQDFQIAEHTKAHLERASEHAAHLFKLSARDLARVGLMMAHDGRWGDRRILSEAWARTSTSPHSAVPPGWQDYGLLWWLPRRAYPFWRRAPGQVFLASGNFGQMLFVDRVRDIVVVHLVDRSRWFAADLDLAKLAALLEAVYQALPPRLLDRARFDALPGHARKTLTL